MQFITYFFASLISYLGLFIGFLLIKIAPEEQKPLEKYFLILRKALLLLMFVFAMLYYYSDLSYLSILILSFIFLLFIEYKAKGMLRKSMLAYFILGILFFLSSKNINLFTIISSLILLHGLPTASLMYKIKEKNFKEILLHNILFVIIANLLYFIF